MFLSIIILNYKTARLVKQCIKNILNLSLPFEYEIVIVDNNSQDEIESVLNERFGGELATGRIKFVKSEKNKGMGAGNNLGVKNSQGEFVLILNPDVVVLENSIQSLVCFLKNNPKVGLVAPQLLYPNKKYQPSCYRFPWFYMPIFMRTGLGSLRFARQKIKEYLMEDVSLAGPHKIDWVRGAVMLVRKEAFEKVGGFDEDFFFYLEDTDLCRRLWQIGYEIWYLPTSQMVHYYSRESGKGMWFRGLFTKIAWIHIGSWLKYFLKWYQKGFKIKAKNLKIKTNGR